MFQERFKTFIKWINDRIIFHALVILACILLLFFYCRPQEIKREVPYVYEQF